MWLCWLTGHRFYYWWEKDCQPTNFCTRCGKPLKPGSKITD